jgi:hypothetical protein
MLLKHSEQTDPQNRTYHSSDKFEAECSVWFWSMLYGNRGFCDRFDDKENSEFKLEYQTEISSRYSFEC